MKNFILSGSGRILALAVGIVLAGNGAAKLLDAHTGLAVGSLAFLVGVALAVVALATAIEEHFEAAVMAIVTLPWALWLGVMGVALVPPSAAFLLVIAGLADIAFAARPRGAPEGHEPRLAIVRSTT